MSDLPVIDLDKAVVGEAALLYSTLSLSSLVRATSRSFARVLPRKTTLGVDGGASRRGVERGDERRTPLRILAPAPSWSEQRRLDRRSVAAASVLD
jgi:hypothetical protein